MTKTTIVKTDETRVTIYFWKRHSYSAVMYKQNVGHVALQTYGEEGIYTSLMPNPFEKHTVTDRKGVKPKLNTYQEDFGQGQKADDTIDLYGLNVSEINHFFNQLKSSGFRYAAAASTAMGDKATHNCATLVRALLIQGGIKNWLIEKSLAWGLFGALSSTLGISITASALLGNAPLLRDIELSMGRGIGLGLSLLSIGVATTYLSEKRNTFITLNSAASSLVAAPISLVIGLFEELHTSEDVDFAQKIFSYSFIAGLTGAFATFSTTKILKLLDEAVITPNDIIKLAKHAEKIQHQQYDFVEESVNESMLTPD